MWVQRRTGMGHRAVHRIVRCSKGHVFTTAWLPGGSLKAVRLGRARFRRPAGRHWSGPTGERGPTDRRGGPKRRQAPRPDSVTPALSTLVTRAFADLPSECGGYALTRENIWRRRAESNRRTGLCRPLPKPLGHAAKERPA
jgi:hypothetical protein